MICPPGKVINPKTGRCIKDTGALAKQLMRQDQEMRYNGVCPEGLEFNPLTGRCLGKKQSASSTVCQDGFVINPSTGRCIKLSGKLGQSLTGQVKEKVREASDYNKFVARALVHIKDDSPESTPQQRMKMAAELWRHAKATA